MRTPRTSALSLDVVLPKWAYLDGDDTNTGEGDSAGDGDVEPAYVIPRDDDGTLNFAGFSDPALGELEATAIAEFEVRREAEDLSAADLTEMGQIADDIDAIRAEAAARYDAAAERQSQIADLAARVAPTGDGDGGDGATGDGDTTTGEGDPAGGDANASLSANADGDAAAGEGEGDPGTGEGTPATTPAGDSAPARRASLQLSARGLPVQRDGNVPAAATDVLRPDIAMVAAAGGSEFKPSGDAQVFDIHDLAEVARQRRMRGGNVGRNYLARLSIDYPDDMVMRTDAAGTVEEKWEKLMAPRDLNQLDEHGALVASGCGPAETIYSHLNDAMLGNVIDVPERVFTRGSMEFPETIDARDMVDQLATHGGWSDGDPAKTVLEFVCPAYRAPLEITARYLILRFKNMVRRSNPELYVDAIAKMLIAHEANKSIDTILDIVAGTGATPLTVDYTTKAGPAEIYTDGCSTTIPLVLELAVEGARNRWMLGRSAALEGIFPVWVQAAIRADIARNRNIDVRMVSDAEVRSLFTSRGVRPQFLDYWQVIPGTIANVEYPVQFTGVLYPANGVVRGTQGTLDLGNEIRDSSLNADNEYELFREDFYTTGFWAHEPVVVTLPCHVTGAGISPVSNVVQTAAVGAANARPNMDLA